MHRKAKRRQAECVASWVCVLCAVSLIIIFWCIFLDASHLPISLTSSHRVVAVNIPNPCYLT
jgi:hypothetical protein